MRKRLLLQPVGILCVTLLLLEAVLRLFPALADWAAAPVRVRDDLWQPQETMWKKRFVEMFRKQAFIFGDCHTHHPTRGWTLVPGSHAVVRGLDYTINHQGFRCLTDYEDDPDRYKVLIVGDSFTFGIEAGDRETWPYFLQQRDASLNVINLAVGGYGLDQMYLTLAEEIDRFRPHLVVAAYIDDDLGRTLLSFRDYAKPRFVLAGDDLALTNVPISDPPTVYRRLTHTAEAAPGQDPDRRLFDSRSLEILTALVKRSRGRAAPEPAADAGEICFRLVKKMQATAVARGADFLLVGLADGISLSDFAQRDFGEEFLFRCRDGLPDLKVVPTRPTFRARRTASPYYCGHYQAREAELVADVVGERIRALASWKQFERRSEAPHRGPVPGSRPSCGSLY